MVKSCSNPSPPTATKLRNFLIGWVARLYCSWLSCGESDPSFSWHTEAHHQKEEIPAHYVCLNQFILSAPTLCICPYPLFMSQQIASVSTHCTCPNPLVFVTFHCILPDPLYLSHSILSVPTQLYRQRKLDSFADRNK